MLRKLFGVVFVLALCLLLLEGGVRVYWKLKKETSFGEAPYLAYYPELKKIRDGGAGDGAGDAARGAGAPVRVLILGGSVMEGFQATQIKVAARLKKALSRDVLIENVAMSGHTSLDSLVKYWLLAGRPYDVVVFYHGINDTRANNCPPELFRADYSHFSWYTRVRALMRHPEAGWWLTPYLVDVALKRAMEPGKLTPTGDPRPEWVKYGEQIKSTDSFRQNAADILALAAERGAKVAFISFAWHIPDNYTAMKFAAKELDYGAHLFPVESWGAPEFVGAGVDAHNAALKEFAGKENVLWVDFAGQAARIIQENGGQGKILFHDPCHFTEYGNELFAEMLQEVIQKALAS